MKKYIVAVSALLLLAGCGLNSDELAAKNEAVKIVEVGKLVVLKTMIDSGSCIVALGDPGSTDRWALTFIGPASSANFHECMTIVQGEMVKATFRDAEAHEKIQAHYEIGEWLNIERLPSEIFLPK